MVWDCITLVVPASIVERSNWFAAVEAQKWVIALLPRKTYYHEHNLFNYFKFKKYRKRKQRENGLRQRQVELLNRLKYKTSNRTWWLRHISCRSVVKPKDMSVHMRAIITLEASFHPFIILLFFAKPVQR